MIGKTYLKDNKLYLYSIHGNSELEKASLKEGCVYRIVGEHKEGNVLDVSSAVELEGFDLQTYEKAMAKKERASSKT